MSITKFLPPSSDPPIWASDTNYPAGADPWSATPTKVAPSAGQIAVGWVPDTEPPAQWMNYIKNLFGQHLASLQGAAVHNWSNHVVIPGTYLTVNAVCTLMSAAASGLPVLAAIGEDAKVYSLYNESMLPDASAVDTGLTGTAVMAGGVFGGSPTLVKSLASGVARKSTNFGTTWAAAGSHSPNATLYHFFGAANGGAGRWVVAHGSASRIDYSTDLSTWTVGAGSASSAPTGARKAASNATACVVVFAGSNTVCARSADGITWTLPTLSAAGHDWRGVAYSSVRGVWMAVASDGVGAKSTDNGLAWTAITVPTGALDVAAIGRYFVCVVPAKNSVGCAIAVSEDLGTTWTEFLIDGDSTATLFERILILDGRLVTIGLVTGGGLRLMFSDRAAWMPVPGAE
jgi:hypothetical protein